MQKHANRHLVAAVLIAAGVLGGFFVFVTHRRTAAIDATTTAVVTRLDRMAATASDIAAAQQGYVAPGQPDRQRLERSAALLQLFGEDSVALPRSVRSSEAADAIKRIDDDYNAIVAIDGRARQYLQQGQNLLATDLVFSEGREATATLSTTLRNLRTAEQTTGQAARAAIEYQQWVVLSIVLTVWIGGVVALARRPAGTVTSGAQDPVERASTSGGVHPPAAEMMPSRVDLTAAAAVFSGLARAADASALKDVLSHLAFVLDAHGIVVWMGAGEQLFPALAHGYDRRLLERMGPIARNAANATAEAWRSGELRTVTSDIGSYGALAAPLVGINGCVGVLAAEVLHGREQDSATCAVVAMFAAQLSGIVSAWPAASRSNVAGSEPIAATGS